MDRSAADALGAIEPPRTNFETGVTFAGKIMWDAKGPGQTSVPGLSGKYKVSGPMKFKFDNLSESAVSNKRTCDSFNIKQRPLMKNNGKSMVALFGKEVLRRRDGDFKVSKKVGLTAAELAADAAAETAASGWVPMSPGGLKLFDTMSASVKAETVTPDQELWLRTKKELAVREPRPRKAGITTFFDPGDGPCDDGLRALAETYFDTRGMVGK
jgi:hypothetical protein